MGEGKQVNRGQRPVSELLRLDRRLLRRIRVQESHEWIPRLDTADSHGEGAELRQLCAALSQVLLEHGRSVVRQRQLFCDAGAARLRSAIAQGTLDSTLELVLLPLAQGRALSWDRAFEPVVQLQVRIGARGRCSRQAACSRAR